MDFAKIFNSEKYGQLCAIAASENDEGKPEVRVFFNPPGLGVCSMAFIFDDTDSGWDSQQKTLDKMNIDVIEEMVSEPFEQSALFTS